MYDNLFFSSLTELPLKIQFTRDTPLVKGNNVTAFIHSNTPVSEMECKMSGTNEVKNCEWVHYL